MMLLAFFEWFLRVGLGGEKVRQWHAELLRTFWKRKVWAEQPRCTVYAMLDTTSTWILAHWGHLPGPEFLAGVALALVCANGWRHLQGIFGQEGLPVPLTALGFAERRQAGGSGSRFEGVGSNFASGWVKVPPNVPDSCSALFRQRVQRTRASLWLLWVA